VKFLVLGDGETCNGDSARRSGNEFLFQQLAAQNVETLNDLFSGVERVDRKIVVTCPHCFNTLGREYPQVGGSYTVLHHTQLLNRLVRDKKLVPVKAVDGGANITYHDPCYLGRHNKVYDAPRELIGASGVTLTEMPRHADRGLCCGAGGARMWMEEHIGKRVNHERVDEALALDPAKIATGCPFCRVMITDGVGDREKADEVEVLDVAQLLLGSLDLSTVTLPEKGTAAKAAAAAAPVLAPPAPKAEPEPAPAEPAATAAAPAALATEAAPVKGLGIAGGAKRPGAKKAAPANQAEAPANQAAAPAAEAPAAEAPAKDAEPVKGLGIASGAKRPGAKKAPAAEAPAAEAPAPAAPVAEEPATAAEPVKGLGIAAGARRPGAKKAPAAAPAASAPAEAAPAAEPAPAAQPAPEPTAAEAPAVEVKGLGIARGARPPGKKS
jgi:hypothetical protein